jgi:hypothetical protein
MKPINTANRTNELEKIVCLLCDEGFFVAAKTTAVCPKCGNRNEDRFAPAELEEPDSTKDSDTQHAFHEAPDRI